MSIRCERCRVKLSINHFVERVHPVMFCEHCKHNEQMIRLCYGEDTEHTVWIPDSDDKLPDEWTHEGVTYQFLVTDALGAFYERFDPAEGAQN